MAFYSEKGLIIIIFMYALSVGLLGCQYVFADVMHIALTSFTGIPIKMYVLNYTQTSTVNTAQAGILGANQTSVVNNPLTAAAGIAWELIQLLSGTYIFNLLLLFNIPGPVIAGFVMIYIFFLARAIMAYIRGI